MIPLRTTESPYKTFMKAFLETAGDISNDKKEELKNILEENDESIEEEVYEYKLMPELFFERERLV